MKEKDRTCPRKRFRDDLIKQLVTWRRQGDRLIVCMDANEDIYKKSIGKTLVGNKELSMGEAVGDFTGKKVGATFFRGKTPIDGVWTTADVVITGACVMPAGFGIGDHRLFVLDFLTSSLVGHDPPKIVRAAARRLNTQIPSAEKNYLERFEDLIIEHKIVERVGAANDKSTSKPLLKINLDTIDKEQGDYMLNAEKKCRKIKSGRIPFSPESSKWIKRARTYRSILRFHAGKIRNKANLKRAARRCGINNCLRISLAEVRARLKVCKEKYNYFRKNGQKYRTRHLKNRLKIAKDKGDEEAETRILAIISAEKQRAYWRRLNYGMRKSFGRSARVVSNIRDNGSVEEYEGQEKVEEAIWSSIHDKRFYLPEKSPICKGKLRGEFGYQANTEAGRQVLNGSYDYDEDFDESSKELLVEITRVSEIIPARSVDTNLRRVGWQRRWSKAKEKTSSSVSGRHFSHYKAGAKSALISHLHALKTSVAV